MSRRVQKSNAMEINFLYIRNWVLYAIKLRNFAAKIQLFGNVFMQPANGLLTTLLAYTF